MIVIELFVRPLLGILVNVLVDPLIDLFVNVSVVALPTNVSVDVGNVRVPVLVIVAITGAVKVNPATVLVVPPREIDVDPSVKLEVVKADVGIFVNVLNEPLIDLLVNVSVVARPTSVSVVVGSVNVAAPFLMDDIVGVVNVKLATVDTESPREIFVVPKVIALYVNAPLGILVNVFVDPLIDLLVSVSVVALPTNVSVDVGKVNVPVFVIVEITGAVNVLLVRV